MSEISLVGEGLNILSTGSFNVLVALGLALTFRLMNVINLAHGEFLMAGAYSVLVATAIGLPFWAAVLVAALVGFVLGAVTELLLVRRFYKSVELSILGTWGLSIVLQQLAELIFGKQHQNVPNPVPGSTMVLGVPFPTIRLLIIAAAIVLTVTVLVVLRYTPIGMQIRAVSADNDLSETLGVPAKSVKMLVFAASTALAAIAGSLIAPIASVGPSMGVDYVFTAFIVVIVAGKRVPMIVVAALAAAVVQNVVTLTLDPVLARIAVLVLAVLVIIGTRRSSRMAPA